LHVPWYVQQLGSTEAGEEEKAKIASLLASMEEHVVVRPSVQAALDDVCSIEGAQGRHVDVFVTGSLYVVGDALAGIQPP
jgi:folylpolyglutamate synthase/dihydropteroate synthase